MTKKTIANPAILILIIAWLVFGLTTRFNDFNAFSIANFTNVPNITMSSPMQWYRALTCLFLSNYGFSELISNSIMLVALSFVVQKITTYSESLIIFIISGMGGNLLANTFIIYLANSQITIPSYLNIDGANGYVVGMSTALFGLLFYTLVRYIITQKNRAKSKVDLFNLTFWVFVCSIPWTYPFLGRGSFTMSDYIHIAGSLVGLLLGLVVTLAVRRHGSAASRESSLDAHGAP
ncbi:rhomboid family intramembrane serine protease [Lacticaseibacillus chiayiensis]|uniref:rhomboid family intramembrane serine protease n=1 Tax=Lacticaseibacillus chiayiensis TaxID=2100821 RepID=UPI00101316DF|nr:rhomboid family intramembrane serine protease [Lacticaseibacillus chiayiensis]RXT56301.1 hypothetical protein CHT97_11620 [Lacticaseibacillus chiayiensis]